jgi:hypothetical protein
VEVSLRRSVDETHSIGLSFMAPRIDEFAGFTVRIYAHDHGPPHVHVRKGNAELRIYIDDKCQVEYVHGTMKASDERLAVRIVRGRREMYAKRWKEIGPQ